ncbi:MAG: RNA methyltransferase [Clostridiales Family XIII bacterium]|jgi:TrmH family RNA methyltransferase|nr:RNA methyltransferase [Clostridiales Family XIII bacterium]
MIGTITSEANSIVKLAKKLRDKRGRDKEDAFLVEGDNLIEEAFKSGARVTHLILREGADGDAVAARKQSDIETVVLSDGLFRAIADTVTPRDVMAIVRKPAEGRRFGPDELAEGSCSLVVLDRIRDPGNVGSILRSAAAADFTGVVAVRGTADIFSPKVVRAASGAVFRLPVYFASDEASTLEALRARDIRSFACDMTGDRVYHEATLTGNVAIIVGNEGEGLSAPFRAGADERVYIPMKEGSESLNASVAASIVMFEKRKQEAIC